MTTLADQRRRWMAPILVGTAILCLDQLTKWWASGALGDRSIDLFWTLRLHLVRNTGAAFSRGEGLGPLLSVLVLVVIVLVVRQGARTGDRVALLAVGAIVGGAVGNLVDRALRSGDGFLGGAVVDFVDFQWWPVFNVADATIVIAGGLLAWRSWGA